MKQNEDGFYILEDCVVALTKLPPSIVSKTSPRLDMRRKDSKAIYAVLKGTPHVAHIPAYGPGGRFIPAIYCSYAVRAALDCEDFDALIDTLKVINQLNQ